MTEQPTRTGITAARLEALKATAFTRAAVLVSLHDRMDGRMWLRLVGELWATTEGDKREVVRLMRPFDDWQPMMQRSEVRVWRALPDWFHAWRGCYAGFNEEGPSYTTDRDAARAYPFVARYRMAGLMPVLRCVWISREDCIVKMDHGRAEVLARVANEWHRVSLEVSPEPGGFSLCTGQVELQIDMPGAAP
ncbi:MAG TPA: hypothetical protein VGM81_11670 [Burkholderiaceae bacterium]|jgi:hypothetical protein